MGIGVVNCVYYNPELDRYWVIDARIYQPDQDGKKKYDHLKDMLLVAIQRDVEFKTVLMDTWYAINNIMMFIDSLGKKFVCPIRSNRLVLDYWTDPDKPKYRAVKDIPWQDDNELKIGKEVKLKKLSLKLRLFRLTVHPKTVPTTWLPMTMGRSGHLITLQKHAHSDGRSNSITEKVNKLPVLVSAKPETQKLNVSTLLQRSWLG